jgi:hypothetical protein
METIKGVVTVSLDIVIFKDWLLTRVKFDPFFLIKVRNYYSNYYYSKHVLISAIETNCSEAISTPVITHVNPHCLLTHKNCHASNNVITSCENYRNLKTGKKFCNNLFDSLFFIHEYKRFFLYNNMSATDGYCHQNAAKNKCKISFMITECDSKTSLTLPLTQLTHICILSRGDFSMIKSGLKYWLNDEIDHGFNSMLNSRSLSARHSFFTFCSIGYDANNILNEKHTSKIKLRSQLFEQNDWKIMLRTGNADRDYNDYTMDSSNNSHDFIKTNFVLISFIKTNSVLIFSHFHALLARDGGQVCPQAHLEVGVKVKRRLPNWDAIEERNQMSDESCTWTLTSSIATVINDPDTAITVRVLDITITGMNAIEAVRCSRNWIATASTAVVIIGTGARARTGAAGCRTAYWSLINPDEMCLNVMTGDQRNICYHTMISKHQLAGTTTFSKRKINSYLDNLNNYNKSLYNYKCCIIYHCKVTIYHLIWQRTNKTYYFIAINGSKSHNEKINAKIINDKNVISVTYFIIHFDISIHVHFCINFCINGTFVYPFDKNVTDKGPLQNAIPDKTILECFMSILSFLIKGSLRTRKKSKNFKLKITNLNRMNFYNKITIFTMSSKALNCHSTYLLC